ncbi:MAG: DUF3999 domain-containing protein [Thiotrichales bacterium]|nr:DUF3999 domain-containing protein [Thiotrichales bacterium]
MMARRSIPGLLLLLFSGIVLSAADAVREDFAFGFQLLTPSGAPIYRLRIPTAIYEQATSADLRDLRVFNAGGSAVPHAIRRQQSDSISESYTTDLPLFPVYRELTRRDISVSGAGSILEIQALDSVEVDPRAGIRHYIIDLSQVDLPIRRLEFTLSGVSAGFLGQARIESSTDLDRWQTVVADSAIAIMHYADHRLIRNHIDVPQRHYQYLRFTWSARRDNVIIDSVRAVHSQSRVKRDISFTVLPGRRPDPEQPVYEFENNSALPVESIDILLPEQNTLIDAVVRSRADADQDRWRQRLADSFYRLNVQGVELQRGPVRIAASRDKHWQLEVTTENGLGTAMPEMRVAWEAGDLYFLARGEGPFTLAYGHAALTEPVKPVQALVKLLNDPDKSELVDHATLGEAIVLRGEPALEPQRQIPWQRLLLWTVLGAGVLVLGAMAIRLVKQMNPSA